MGDILQQMNGVDKNKTKKNRPIGLEETFVERPLKFVVKILLKKRKRI